MDNTAVVEAGEELDLLIERVYFGRVFVKAQTVTGWKVDGRAMEPGRYSRDIADTYRLIDHLNNRKWPERAMCVIIATHHDGNPAACMMFEGRAASHKAADTFVRLPDYDTAGFFVDTKSQNMNDWFKPAIRVQAKTPMLAVCLAALDLARQEGKL